MHASDLRPVPGSVHKKKRIGRGNSSGHGTYSGRGIKGQKSRSGPDLRIGFEGGQIPLVRALSRKRGFKNRFRVEYEPVNIASLARFEAGTKVDLILGEGDLGVALTVEADRFSASARAKIEAAGGKIIELQPAATPEAESEESEAEVASE